MFKIVETLERGLKKLTIIPSAWEKNGELAWPKFKADQLIRNSDSVPKSSWFRMVCKLKRNHLLNYEIAEEELERMLDVDDSTEQEDEIGGNRRRNVSLRGPEKNDFNDMIKTCLMNKNLPPTALDTVFENTVQFENNSEKSSSSCQDSYVILETEPALINCNQQIPSYFENLTESSNIKIIMKLDKILENQTTIIQNQNNILENIKHLGSKENQILILQQFAKFETMLDTVGDKIYTRNVINDKRMKFDEVEFKKIDNLENAVKFEKILDDPTTMENVIRKLSCICGTKGNANGINSCYILVDVVFSRKFMKLCCWAGGSRDQKEKIAFKAYKNIINLCFKVVQLSDQNFTLKDCADFFKSVIRNATRRSESNLNRTSTSKKRLKNLTYKIQNIEKVDGSSRNIVNENKEARENENHDKDTKQDENNGSEENK